MGTKQFRGITLIVLAIIIIILLILSVVIIASLDGENGLIAKINQAKNTQMKSEMRLLTYEIKSREGKKLNVLVTVTDKENGLKTIEYINDGYILNANGKKTVSRDCSLQLGVEYNVKISFENGEEKTETILLEEYLEINSIIIGESENSTTSVEDNSITRGTPLYINIKATLVTASTEDIECIITNKDDSTKNVPFEIKNNGRYFFIATGMYDGKKIEREIKVEVNKYKAAVELVKYDAGSWTKEEIDELERLSLYDLNAKRELSAGYKFLGTGFNFTFGGFTYEGDLNYEEEIENGDVVTSRNKSVRSGIGTPYYDGWQVLEKEYDEGRNRTYIKKIIHAGAPENFVLADIGHVYVNYAEYIISSGKKATNYKNWNSEITLNPRSFDMYIDKNQRDLVKEVHCINGEEALKITGNGLNIPSEISNTGAYYYFEDEGINTGFSFGKIDNGGYYHTSGGWLNECYGIRPVVEMVDGVYIVSGSGTELDPYVLGKD